MNEFDIKASGWDQNPMHRDRSEAIVNALMKRIPLTGDMTALEYGAGTGITSFLLSDHLKEISMMDSSSEMVKIMNEKISFSDSKNLKAIFFDLEKDKWTGNPFDLIVTQMVLHHVTDIMTIIDKFHKMLNPGGCLAIADLYPEDGSFHGIGFTGYKGFDPNELSAQLMNHGFTDPVHRKCFVINKKTTDNIISQFDVFLLTAYRI